MLGFSILVIVKMLFAAFNGILFSQSGLDKVFDYGGSLAYFNGFFKKSPLASVVGMLLPVITALEVTAGFTSLAGFLLLLVDSQWGQTVAAAGMLLGAVSMVSLFFGQRIAKDYAGAAVSVPYFLMAALGLFLYSL